MKKWTNAEFKAIDIRETASGLIDGEREFWVITNDNNKKSVTPEVPVEDPEEEQS